MVQTLNARSGWWPNLTPCSEANEVKIKKTSIEMRCHLTSVVDVSIILEFLSSFE